MTEECVSAQINFADYLEQSAVRVNQALNEWLPSKNALHSARLNEAVRYSALAGGKRIRPVLCLMAAQGAGCDSEAALRAGCAFELIHTYSLIHDDLPAMDNDDFRRGRPTCHKKFDEATAILAGDSLLTMAFAWLAELVNYGVSAEKTVEIIALAASAAGHDGMVGGQMLDIAWEKQRADLVTLETIHHRKTGALITAPIVAGAIIAGLDIFSRKKLEEYGAHIGLLFQIVDDILDVEGDAAVMGKTLGKDALLEKSTYPSLLGLDKAHEYALQVHRSAVDSLSGLEPSQPLLEAMADFILHRKS